MLQLDVDKAITGKVMTISGNVGNGKNTLAVGILRVLSKKCIHNKRLEFECEYCVKYGISQKERKIRAYSNFRINLPEIECFYLATIEDFVKIPKLKQHSVCVLDEPNAWGFDSRSSMSKENRAIGYKIQHCRHYNMDIIFLTQLWSMVDLRGKRLSSDTVLAVEPSPREFQYGLFKYDEIIPISMKKTYARDKIFPYFDTSQIIGESEQINNELADNSEVYSA